MKLILGKQIKSQYFSYSLKAKLKILNCFLPRQIYIE